VLKEFKLADHSEVLNVRWATVDPNPAAAKREARMIEEQAAEAVRRALPPEYVAELEGRDPEAKKRRKIEGSFGLQGYDAPDDVWYAREKAGWIAQSRGIEGGEEQQVFEGGDDQRMLEPPPAEEEGGIFSSSTIAAIKGQAGAGGLAFAATTTTTKSMASTGPLVGYGSDDESD
jgi:hypothetical protein